MLIRVTIVLDEKVIKKLRIIQARQIRKTKKGCSLSKLINSLVRVGLEKDSIKNEKTAESSLKTAK